MKTNLEWKPISTAPKDSVVLVNDTNFDDVPWVAAKYIACAEWSGWVYCDELLNDSCPLGPQPTHWFDIPSLKETK